MLAVKKKSVQKGQVLFPWLFSWFSYGFKPDFQVIVLVIWFCNINEDVTKNTWWQSFLNFSRKRLWWSLFYISYKPIVHKKLAALKIIFWEKCLWWPGILIQLQPSSTQPKMLSETMELWYECIIIYSSNSFASTGKPPWRTLLFNKVEGLEFISAT